jgi:hypothetical protein
LLVTGIKLWHLNYGSKGASQNATNRSRDSARSAPGQRQHYAAWQFWEAVGALSPGSWVVLLLGELDCREGMMKALRKMKVRGPSLDGVGSQAHHDVLASTAVVVITAVITAVSLRPVKI